MPTSHPSMSTTKSHTASSSTKMKHTTTLKSFQPNNITTTTKPHPKSSPNPNSKPKPKPKHHSPSPHPQPNNAPPNLWKEAYNALQSDPTGKARLQKLATILKTELGLPTLKLRSPDGYHQLLALMAARAHALETPAPTKADKVAKMGAALNTVREHMANLQEIVTAGATAAGPYVAIPAAALMVAFSMDALYRAEKSAMWQLAEELAHCMVLQRKAHVRVAPRATDDVDMRDLKARLHVVYVALHKSMLLAAAQLVIAAHAPFQYVKNIAKHYDWAGQHEGLVAQARLCAQYRDEMESWASLAVEARPARAQQQQQQRSAMGPGPRNSLHWAVALSVPEQVVHFVTNRTYPINALSPRSWTAVHFAAREGNAKVLKTLLTAPGVDLLIRDDDGMTPLHIATLWNKVGAVKLLLQREPRLLGVRDKGGRTAWLWAAARGHVDVLKVLKGEGHDVNDATQGGWNALHLAGESDRVNAVRYLVSVGTRRDARIKEGWRKGTTPKQLAVQKGKTGVLEFL
jgi:hypothetical protein